MAWARRLGARTARLLGESDHEEAEAVAVAAMDGFMRRHPEFPAVSAFAYTVLRGRLVTWHRQELRARRNAQLARPPRAHATGLLDALATREQILRLLRALPKRERLVVRRHYGLAGKRAQTFAQIASAMGPRHQGVSTRTVERLHAQALVRLRGMGIEDD
jgi:DNA-directed RNA polymerase specialized sigma24 family protein